VRTPVVSGSCWWRWDVFEPEVKRMSKKAKKQGDELPVDDCPYQILEVDENADLKEIKKAYRLKVQAYHPDKVAGLGVELQKLADTMTKKINDAYEMLKAAHKS
jgi:DnaJ-class molecular chaperone